MKKSKPKKKRTRSAPISFYPLKAEDVLRAFMQVDPRGIVNPRGSQKREKSAG